MTSEREIEAATNAIATLWIQKGGDPESFARAALEAAERVREQEAKARAEALKRGD